jgi:hypothetical protein
MRQPPSVAVVDASSVEVLAWRIEQKPPASERLSAAVTFSSSRMHAGQLVA